MSRQSIYGHFDSRAGLMVAMVQHLDDESGGMREHVQSLLEAPTALQALDIALKAPGDYYPVVYPLAKPFMIERHTDPEIAAAWNDRMAARHELCELLVRRLDEEGVLANGWRRETATDMLWTLSSWEVWEFLVVERQWSKDQFDEYLRATVYRTLVAERSIP